MASSPRTHAKPRRRLQGLAAAIVLGAAAYTGGWYWAAGKLSETVSAAMVKARQGGQEIACDSHEARGFPFRMGLFCNSVSVRLPGEGVTVAAGALRSAAQIYQPSKIIAELDGPGLVEAPRIVPLKLDWENLRASFVHDNGTPERISVETSKLSVGAREAADGLLPLADVEAAEAHARANGEAIDIAASGNGIAMTQPGLTAIPAARFSLDATLPQGRELVRAGAVDPAHPLRGQTIELRHLTYAFPEEQATIALKGTLSVGMDGLADGTVEVRVENPEAFGDAARIAFPDAAADIDPIVNGLKAVTQSGNPVTITLQKGRMSAGLFPLGELPPF